jgi:cytochrome c oxidase subunit 1
MVSSVGALITAAGTLLFFYILWHTARYGAKAAANPWGEGATTLEWTVPSPAPFHTFEEQPVIGAGTHHVGHAHPRPAE